jgi:hypothetical protein
MSLSLYGGKGFSGAIYYCMVAINKTVQNVSSLDEPKGNCSAMPLQGGVSLAPPVIWLANQAGVLFPPKQSPVIGRLLRQNQERLAATWSVAEQLCQKADIGQRSI